MIHIATVHWEFDDWVDIQLKYLHKHIREPFQVYAYLNKLKHDHSEKFYYSSTDDIESHPLKLNLLAEHIVKDAGDDDLLVFIDGDAFPIADIVAHGRDRLKDYRLIAIQRKENFGDIQPHPAYCMTTVKFWKDIKGDWQNGYVWRNLRGESVRDVGGNLLKLLLDNRIQWYPMVRSNRQNLHPLFFGIYDNVVYHHGAGFRRQYCRMDAVNDGKVNELDEMGYLRRKMLQFIYKRKRSRTIKYNEMIAADVFNRIMNNESFYKDFI